MILHASRSIIRPRTIRRLPPPLLDTCRQVGYKVPWTAISSLLGYLSRRHGPSILLHLNLAYMLPALPVLAAQSLAGEALERRAGVARSTAARWGALAL